uniref:Tyrotropin-releasing hormone n=1 Tax=Polyphagotarsonemus latus TaxID=1204166 RepID=A0AAN0LW16_9ACAR
MTITKLMNSSSTLALLSSASNVTYEYPSYIRNTATVICIIIFIFGTLGNVLVSLIIIRSKELRNTTNYFLINLSIADLLVIIVCMPTVLIELHSKPEIWLLGEFMCKTIPYVEMSVAHGSILTMLAISFERYYAICKPLKVSYKCTKFRAILIILGIWIIALIATLPLLFIAKQSSAQYLDETQVEVCLTQANDAWSKAFFLIIITLFFFLPLMVLVIIYVAITKKLCAKENISYAETIQMRARKQVVVMLATVILCFFICLLPFRLFTLWLLFSSSQALDSIGMEAYYCYLFASRVMLYLNSALNPVLYNLISSKFRNAFVQILCCRKISNSSRYLFRQSTINTTTTAMSLGTNVIYNSSMTTDDKKYKRNSCFVGSLKQMNLTNLNPNQLKYQLKGRQSSLQQFPTTNKTNLKPLDCKIFEKSICINSIDNNLDENSNDKKKNSLKKVLYKDKKKNDKSVSNSTAETIID